MELFRALAAFAEPPGAATARLTTALGIGEAPTAAEYTRLFTLELYPYASVYLGPEGMLGGEGRDRIAGFWRALGMTPPPEPDHLALMLAQYAGLAELAAAEADAARAAALERARGAYLHEHLLSWLPPWLDKLAELAPPSYASWGRVLEAALLEEGARFGVAEWPEPMALRIDVIPSGGAGSEAQGAAVEGPPGVPATESEPGDREPGRSLDFARSARFARDDTAAGASARDDTAAGASARDDTAAGASARDDTAAGASARDDTAAGASARDDTSSLLSSLLAPARSGIILTRADLARAGRDLGLGTRVGERRFVLRALLAQAPEAVLEWMGVEAEAWARRHAERRPALGAIAAAWERRALATARHAAAR